VAASSGSCPESLPGAAASRSIPSSPPVPEDPTPQRHGW
jgi:hypothetical protein